MNLPALVRPSQQDVCTSLTILGCTGNCRFQFADCPLIHCVNMARWCSGFVQASTPRVTRFDSQQSTFSRRGWIFYFTLKHGLRIVLHTICFLFIYFSMKFMYNVNRTSSDDRIAPAHFLTDCWATLTGKDKEYILIICNHGNQPRRGREI